MKKRIMSLVMCIAFVLGGALNTLAAVPETSQGKTEAENVTGEVKVYSLSLADAIKLAHERDPQYANLDLKIKDAEKQLADAKRTKKDLEGKAIPVSQGLTTFAVQRGYYVNQAEISLESAKYEKEQTLANSAYSITQKYYNVKLAESLVETAENTYKLTTDNLENVKAQFALGMVAQIDVNNAQYSVNQAKAMLEKNKRNLEIARSQFAIALYIDEEDFILNLTDNLDHDKFTTDVDADKKNAMQSRYDVYRLDSAISQAELMLKVSRVFGTTSAEYSSSNLALTQCRTSNVNSKKSIALLIDSSYYSIMNAEDELLLAEESLSLAKQSYDIALAQYNLGLITNSQLTSAINNTKDAGIGLENAKLNYKLAVEKYKYEISIGL